MRYLHDVQSVNPARLVAAVDHFLDPDRAAIITITPDATAPRGGKIIEEVRR